MAPQHRPCIEERLMTDSAIIRTVMNEVPLWIFNNLDEDSESSNDEEDAINAEASAQANTGGSSEQSAQQTVEKATNPGNQPEAGACPNSVPLWLYNNLGEDSESSDAEVETYCRKSTAAQGSSESSSHRSESVTTVVENSIIQETSSVAQTDVANGPNDTLNTSNNASLRVRTRISQKRTNKTTVNTVSQIPTAIFDTFNSGSGSDTLEDLNCSPYDPIPLDSIKLETFSNECESCGANYETDDDRSRLATKQIKLHTSEGIVRQQNSSLTTATIGNSEGSSDLFSYSTSEDDRPQLHMAHSEPITTRISVERVQPVDHVRQFRSETQAVQHSNVDHVTIDESPIRRLRSNAGDFLRPTIAAKLQLHESLRSMLPGLYAKQLVESERFDPLPLIEQKLSLIHLVAAALQRSYCKNADLGCIVSIAAQLAYGNPNAACLLWRS